MSKMTTMTSLRRERDEWKKRALKAEERTATLVALFDLAVVQMAKMLNLARNTK